MQIDTRILRQYFFHESGGSYDLASKMNSWIRVVDLEARAFKAQGPNGSLVFRGSLFTDGVGVSIVKSNQETRAGGPRRR